MTVNLENKTFRNHFTGVGDVDRVDFLVQVEVAVDATQDKELVSH